MIKRMLVTLGLLTFSATAVLANPTTLYSGTFEGLPLDTNLVNTDPWFGNNFGMNPNPSQIRLDGPGGERAGYYPNSTVGWYGGFLRGPSPNVSTVFTPANTLADISLTFWLKGTSSGAFGNVGVSVLSFDADGETGAAYQAIQVPSDWTEFTLQFDEMGTGIPGHGTEGNAFSLADIDRLQVMFWARDPHEVGWPVADDPEWSFSVTEIQINVIPEPSAYVAIFGILALAVAVWRRRFKR